MSIHKSLTKAMLEKRIGAILVRKRAAIGPGQMRFGWFSIHPCRDTWRGRTLNEVATRLDAADRSRRAQGYE